jgi:hypothetical protein
MYWSAAAGESPRTTTASLPRREGTCEGGGAARLPPKLRLNSPPLRNTVELCRANTPSDELFAGAESLHLSQKRTS